MSTDTRRYAAAISLWECHRLDTSDIARTLGLAEAVVAKWIANWRDMVVSREAAS